MTRVILPETIPPRAAALIAAVRARGNEPPPRWDAEPRADVDVRDAAHEAHHGFVSKASTWERETIHRRLLSALPVATDRWIDELTARVVEREVVISLGLAIDPIEEWIFTSIREAMGSRLPFVSDMGQNVQIANAIAKRSTTAEAIARVLALADAAPFVPRALQRSTSKTGEPRRRRRVHDDDPIRISGLQSDHEAAIERYAQRPGMRSPIPIEIRGRVLVVDYCDADTAADRLQAIADRAFDDGDEEDGYALVDLATRIEAAVASRDRARRP